MIYEHYKVKNKGFFNNLSKTSIVLIIVVVFLAVISASIWLTRESIKKDQSINQTVLKGFIQALELKTAYGYNYPEQKLDIPLTEYAWHYLVTENQPCHQKSLLKLKDEDKNVLFIDCKEVIRIGQDPIGKNISIFIPQENNSDQFSSPLKTVPEYRFFIDFVKGYPDLLDYNWNLIDKKGKIRSIEFCEKHPALCKYIHITKEIK